MAPNRVHYKLPLKARDRITASEPMSQMPHLHIDVVEQVRTVRKAVEKVDEFLIVEINERRDKFWHTKFEGW